MSDAQIPLWITVGLAIYAPMGTLAGALGGQWIASRSTRARELDNAERGRAVRWEERRFAALAAYVIIADSMYDCLCYASFLVSEKQTLDDELTGRMSELEEESRMELSKVRLAVSPAIHYECQSFHDFFHMSAFKIRRGDSIVEDSHTPGNAFAKRLDELVRKMQQELGNDDPSWW